MVSSTLKILREVHNYTQEFVAENILGISQNTYSRLESNPLKITAEQAQKLSRLYKVSIADLLSDKKLEFYFANLDGDDKTSSSSTAPIHEKELALLRQELEYFKKQNLELLKLVSERKD